MIRNPITGGSLRRAHLSLLLAVTLSVLLLAGCGMFGAAEEAPTPEAGETRVLVPTFTATPEGQSTPTPQPIVQAVTQLQPITQTMTQTQPAPQAAGGLAAAVSVTGPVTATGSLTATAPLTAGVTPTLTAAAKARLTIEQDLINVRTGPGTNYSTGGSAAKGEAFDIIGKNEAGDWWLVCCVSGEPVWIFNQLGRAESAESVPVATPPAVAVAPQPAAQAPAAPVAPAPAATDTPAPAPAPPAEGDPCAGIGGDGCKFKLKAGPAFASNGGSELKLTLGFIHSGIDGGQPQGSYFVVLLKDGQNVGVPDSVRSFDPSVGMRDGPNGKYNYEHKIPPDTIPGGVAGNYTIWVLDGNGERDSQSFNFTVPDGQGEVYILFDQA